MKTLFIILRICEAVACVTAFAYWKKVKGSHWRYFPIYLAFIVLSEFIGGYLTSRELFEANFVFYGYFEIPVEFLFLFSIFHVAFKDRSYRWLSVISVSIYLVSWLLDIIYFNKNQYSFYSFSYTVGNLLLLIFVLQYFIQLVTSNAILNFKHDMLFWVCTGLLLYYLGTFPYYGLRNTLAYNYPSINLYYSYIVYILDSLMYLMFTLSFIWGKPNTKSL